MRPGLAKIIEKIRISTYFESAETDLHIAENACWIVYADTWSSKRVHWLLKNQSMNSSPTNDGFENTLGLDTGVAWVNLQITRINPRVAWESNRQRAPTILYNTGWVDYCQVCYGRFMAIPVLDPVDVKNTYNYSASPLHCLQWDVRWYGWCDVSFGQEEDPIEGRLILCHEVCVAEFIEILCWSYYYDRYAPHFGIYPWSFLAVAIVYKVGRGNGYKSWRRDFLHYPIPGGLSEVFEERILS